MTEQTFTATQNGGVRIEVTTDDGTEKTVVFEPDDDGNIIVEGIGPNGSKRGEIDLLTSSTP